MGYVIKKVQKKKRKSILFSYLFELFIICCIIGLGLLFLIPLQRLVNTIVDDMKAHVLTEIGDILEAKVQYSGINPSLFRFIEIDNITITRYGETKPFISFKSITVRYNILNLVRQNYDIVFQELVVHDAYINLDLRKDEKRFQRITDALQANTASKKIDTVSTNAVSSLARWISENTNIGIHLFTIDFHIDFGEPDIYLHNKFTFLGKLTADMVTFSIIDDVMIRYKDIVPLFGDIYSDNVRLNGSFNITTQMLDVLIRFSSIQSNSLGLKKEIFRLIIGKRNIDTINQKVRTLQAQFRSLSLNSTKTIEKTYHNRYTARERLHPVPVPNDFVLLVSRETNDILNFNMYMNLEEGDTDFYLQTNNSLVSDIFTYTSDHEETNIAVDKNLLIDETFTLFIPTIRNTIITTQAQLHIDIYNPEIFQYAGNVDAQVTMPNFFQQPFRITGNFWGDILFFRIPQLQIRVHNIMNITFQGNLLGHNGYPQGQLAVTTLFSFMPAIQLQFTVNRASRQIWLHMYNGRIGTRVMIPRLDANFNFNRIGHMQWQILLGFFDTIGHDIIWNGQLAYEPFVMDGYIQIKELSITQILYLLQPEFANISRIIDSIPLGFELKTRIEMAADEKNGFSMTMPFMYYYDTIQQKLLGSVNGRYGAQIIQLNSLYINTTALQLEMNGFANFAMRADQMVFALNVVLNDEPFDFSGTYVYEKHAIQMSNDTVDFSMQLSDEITGVFSITQIPLGFLHPYINNALVPVSQMSVSFAGNFFYKDLNTWHIQFENMQMYDAQIASQLVRISADIIYFDATQVTVDNLIYGSNISQFIFFSQNIYENGIWNINVSGQSSRNEDIAIVGTIQDNDITIELVSNQIAIEHFYFRDSDLLLTGTVAVNVLLSGKMTNPHIQMDVQSQRLLLADTPLALQASAIYFDDMVTIANMDVNNEFITTRITDTTFAIQSGEILLHAQMRFNTLKMNKFIRITIEGDILNETIRTLSDVSVKSLFEDTNIYARLYDMPFSDPFAKNLFFHISGTGYKLYVTGGLLLNVKMQQFLHSAFDMQTSFEGFFGSDGTFEAHAKKTFVVQFSAQGIIKNDTISANINNIVFNLNLLEPLLSFDVFVLQTGIAYGDLRIVGDLANPYMYGMARVQEVQAYLEYTPKQLRVQQSVLLFNMHTMSILSSSITTGDRFVGMLEGKLLWKNWVPYAMKFTIDTQDNGIFPLDALFVNTFVKGIGIGNITIYSDDFISAPLHIEGDVALAEATIVSVQNAELEKSDTEDAEHKQANTAETPLVFNMTLKVGRSVEYLWPSATVPIIQATIQNGDSIVVTFETIPKSENLRSLSFIGEVDMASGIVYAGKENFKITTGYIQFNETKDFFDPSLQIAAELRTIYNNEPYTVQALVSGTLQNMNTTFSSENLSDAEINQIVGGVLPFISNVTTENTVSFQNLLSTGNNFFNQLGIVREAQNSIRRFLGFDLFTISSDFVGIALGSIIDSRLQNMGTPSFSDIVRYLRNTELSVGKYIDDTIFLNGGVRVINSDEFNIKTNLGLNIGLQIQLPFGMVGWGFSPQLFGLTQEGSLENIFKANRLTLNINLLKLYK